MLISFDFETACFAPGYRAPRAACLTWQRPGLPPKIVHAKDAEPVVREFLTGKDVLVGQNTAYDTVVICANWPHLMPLVFRAYDEDRITCTKIREQCIDIALGRFRGSIDPATLEWVQRGYSLDDLSARYRGKRLDKDTWRLRYGEFLDVPLEDWPAGAREYPLEDAVATLDVALAQEQAAHFLSDQFRQARAQVAFAFTSCWGLKTAPAKVEKFAVAAEEHFEDLLKTLQVAGIVRKNGTADTKAAQEAMQAACDEAGIKPVMTPGGKISLGADACARVDDQVVNAYSEFQTARKIVSTDVEMLRDAAQICHPSYDMTKTGRSTCSRPNIQNLRKLEGIRECFVPDEGNVYIQCDYPGLELYTMAQWSLTVLGYSAAAEALNADADLHLQVGAKFMGLSYDEAFARKHEPEIKKGRQGAKAFNFGAPGGLGHNRLVELAKHDYGVDITVEEAKDRLAVWKRALPEMVMHFRSAAELTDNASETGGETSPFTGQVTAGKRYTEICNERFQRLGADIAKSALYRVAKACYIEEHRALFGMHPVAFIHDEIIVEGPEERSAEAARELAEIMCEAANVYLVGVPMKLTGKMKLEPLIMRCWQKSANPTYDAQGRLIPCP